MEQYIFYILIGYRGRHRKGIYNKNFCQIEQILFLDLTERFK